MATASFSVALSIEDSLFGKDIQFANRRVELWIKGDSYDELVGESYTDNYIYAYFNFDLEYTGVLVLPVVYFKIFDQDEVVSYTFPAPGGKTVTLAEGENNLTALVKLKDTDTDVTNEVVECNAVLTDEDDKPYANVSVSINVQVADTVIQELGRTEPNPLGFFGYSFIKDRDLSALIRDNTPDLQFRFRYYGVNGELLDEETKLFAAIKDFRDLLILKINLPQQKLINSESIDNLASTIGLTIPSNLQAFFASTGIATLRNIRSFGGLKRIPALQDPIYDQAVIARLDGHAQLETLSGDFLANDHVIAQGYNAVYKVALASRSVFASKVVEYGTIGDFEAAKMHQIASAHNRLFQTVYVNYRNKLNYFEVAEDPTYEEIIDEINDKCNCDACESAISPVAYLADLIWYAQNHLVMKLTPPTPPVFGFHDGDPVTPEVLKEIFCNDFCLSEDYCDLINEKICQYRIAIETLNCFREHLVSPTACQTQNLNEAERKYLITAYLTLLEQMGTTYYEVRDVKNSNDLEKKKELADKLGIALSVASYEGQTISTDILYFDPYNSALSNEDFNIRLEDIFGLRVFTKSCTAGQDEPLIKEWKEAFLRLQWEKQDSNQDAYSLATEDNPKPILDPDIVTIDDFKDPDISSPSDALEIWLHRKEFIEKVWNDVFRANLTPHGAQKGERYITVAEDYAAEFAYGKRFVLVDNTDPMNPVEYVYTAEYAVYDSGDTETRIHILEKLELGTDPTDWQIRFLDSSEITGVSGSDITITDSTLTTSDINDLVEIIASDSASNGVYGVTSVSSGTVTVTSPVQWTSPAYADLYFYRTIGVIDAHIATTPVGYIRLQGDVATELADNYWGTLSNSENNDGKYTIDNIQLSVSDPDIPNFYTQFEVSEQLPETADDGEFTYLSESISPIDDIEPHMGARLLEIDDSSFYDAMRLNPDISLEFEIGGNPPVSLNITSIDLGVGVHTSQALTGNETGGTVKIKHDDIVISSGVDPDTYTFGLSGDYRLVSPLLQVNIDGTLYDVEDVSYTSDVSSFIVSGGTAPSSPATSIVVEHNFPVTGVDISGRKFTIPAPLLPDLTIDTDTINTIKGSKNIAIAGDPSSPPNNNGKYTLQSVSAPYDDMGVWKIDLFVEEAVLNEVAISSGTLKYKEKTVTIFYQHPKIQAIFDYFQNLSFPQGTPAPSPAIIPWEDATSVTIATFIGYRETLLTSTDTVEINDTLDIIENDLHLTRDSFIRLANIAEKYSLEITGDSTDRVTQDEYTELFNILISAVKKAYQSDWYDEEVTTAIKLDYKNFWQSLTEPVEGNNDNSIALSRLLVDPQLIGLNKVPDMPAGLEAINLWNRRNDYLVRLRSEIKTIRISQGFNQAVAFGLESYGPLGNVPVVNWNNFWAYYNTLLNNLNSIDTSTVEAAEKEINGSLSVSVEEFRTIMQLHQRLVPNAAGQITNPPTQDEYEKLYQILIGSYKRRVLYPEWRKYESVTYFHFYDTNVPVDRERQNYWLSSKAKLPKWRASAAERQEWLNALASRSIRPIIDPDLVFPNDIVDPTNPAYTIWNAREGIIAGIVNGLPTTGDIEDNISTALQTTQPAFYDFPYLLSADEAGEDIRPRLAQLHITYQGFSRLKVLIGVGYAGMTPDEKSEYKNILAQAIKIRDYYAAWRDQESDLPDQDDTITLSPDFFKINPPAYNSNPVAFYEELPQWRATWQERTNWVQTLTARIDQLNDAGTSIKNIIDETEKQVLPIIRDGLVMFCGQEYATLLDNAKALETRLLVDFSINCCQETTRVAHAIDVMQKLLWSENLGIDKNIRINETTTLEFVLHADHFEEEWRWLGSYATWRAAMFVFMYPENLLLPSLRRYQTPAFIKLVNEVQGNNRLTPLAACRAAKDYSEYYEDIASLEPEASCITNVKYQEDSCINKKPKGVKKLSFIFATGKKNNKAYYHTKDINDSSIDSYSLWARIDGLGEHVIRIVGSSVYQQDDDVRHILVFAVVYEEISYKFVFIKYDLEKQSWDNEYTELSMPDDDVDYSSITVWTCSNDGFQPEIIYKGIDYPAIFANKLNKKAKDWDGDWQIISPAGNTVKYATTIHSYIILQGNDDKANDRMIVASNAAGEINYKLVGTNDDLTWRSVMDKDLGQNISAATVLGVFNIDKNTRHVTVMFRQDNLNKQVVIKPTTINRNVYLWDNNITDSHTKIRIVSQFDIWLKNVLGSGLSDISLTQSMESTYGVLKRTYLDRKDRYAINYHRDAYNSPYFLDKFRQSNLSALFQAYQCLWDKNINDENTERKDIDNIVINACSWFCDTFISKFTDENYIAADFKWLDSLIKDDTKRALILFYYTDVKIRDEDWSAEFTDGDIPTSLKILINALLRMSVARGLPYELLSSSGSGSHAQDKKNSRVNITLPNFGDLKTIIFLASRNPDDYSKVNTVNQFYFDYIRHYSGDFPARVAVKNYNNNSGGFSVRTNTVTLGGDKFVWLYATIQGTNQGYYRIAPIIPTTLFPITEELSDDELAVRSSSICVVMKANDTPYDPIINREYMREAWYFVPMQLGVQLSQAAQYEAALKWFRTVYNYHTGLIVYTWLGLDFGDGNDANDWTRNMTDWLIDPLNPHAIALGRQNNYLKYTISTIAQTFKSYADAQFTLDTVESVSRAKELYYTAEELMSNDIFKLKPDECFIDWNETVEHTFCIIKEEPGTTIFRPGITGVYNKLGNKIKDIGLLNTHLAATQTLLTADVGTPGFNMSNNLVAAASYVDGLTPTPSSVPLQSILDGANTQLDKLSAAAMSQTSVELAGLQMKDRISTNFTSGIQQITNFSTEKLSDKNLHIGWLKDIKGTYTFNYAGSYGGTLIKERDMSFSRPNAEGAYTIAANMNPQAALDAIDKYPFPYIPNSIGGEDFCVAPNPTYDALKMSIQLNLFKIRNCMNIAGMKRELDPYAAPTDLYSGLPQIGANGQLMLPGTVNIRPTIYRYRFLLERAKQLTNMAQQVESAFLAALEKYDSERYNMLKAKQDLSLAKATVKLKELQVKVSEGEVDLASLQKERSQIQVQELDNMINAGLNSFESQMIDMYWASAALQSVIAGIDFALSTAEISGSIIFGVATNAPSKAAQLAVSATLGAIKLGSQVSNNFLEAGINVNSIYAAQARREQSWNYEKTLATQDIKIGEQQVKVAQDRVRVSEQDRAISELQVSNAEATIDFLNTKFTNADLYNWMSGVLEKAYSYFIQEAANAARLAQNQLAFERQELPQGIIQDDYWELPAAAASLSGGSGPDRRGLTGSTRLLVDITKLESYAIDSQKRKLQITKSFSLASFFPMEFQQFKETGQITFDTLMDYFDQDFPGHYLRLINQVRVNIVALVPPVQGIKATLTSSGISHVVIGGSVYQDVIVRRDPETIALSGNRESNGSFELQPMDSELLNPFESSGVHTRWQLKMSKAANHFDFATIADVVVTIDYTALSSSDYERQVQQRSSTNFKSQRAFSFRNEFSDAFYQWTHPDEFNGNRKVSVNISALDFPANLSNVKIRELKFYIPTDTSNPDELVFSNPTGKGVSVTLAQSGTTNATPVSGQAGFNSKGIISTLTNGGNLSSLIGKSPTGTWSVKLNGLDTALDTDKIQDVIMVVTYEAQTPQWI